MLNYLVASFIGYRKRGITLSIHLICLLEIGLPTGSSMKFLNERSA